MNSIPVTVFLGDYTLLLSQALLDEFTRRVTTKPYLVRRIDTSKVNRLVNGVLSIAEVVPFVTTEIPQVTRDPKDDYLIAYALAGRADYLVTGDEDVLTLGQVGELWIVTPRQFVALLETPNGDDQV